MYLRLVLSMMLVVLLPQFSWAVALNLNFPFTTKEGVKVETLAQLNSWLTANYTGGDVNIYIAANTYTGSVSWTFHATSGTLKIAGKDPANPPIFDGCLKGCLQGESSGFFMRLQNKSKTLNNISLQRLKIKNYVNGILIANANNVSVNSVVFENIGTAFNSKIPTNSQGAPSWGGYAALMTDESTGLKISQNKFIDCYNKDNPLWFHAVYLKSTVNSTVSLNEINMISGDPIRLRHGCSNIRVTSNNIKNSGMSAVSTFEQAGEECPSTGIKASSNLYGMMFPFKQIFSQAGFATGWANKKYINEGLVLGQGYKVYVDPDLSPSSCAYRNADSKWQVFASNLNSYVMPTADSRILSKSVGVETETSIYGTYAKMVKNSELVFDTNMFFVGCNSDTSSTCLDNGTTDISDDRDPFNKDNEFKKYLVRLKVRMGTVTQKILLSGGAYKDYAVSIAPNSNYDASGWASVDLPVSLSVVDRSKAILRIKTLNSGLKVHSVHLVESQ